MQRVEMAWERNKIKKSPGIITGENKNVSIGDYQTTVVVRVVTRAVLFTCCRRLITVVARRTRRQPVVARKFSPFVVVVVIMKVIVIVVEHVRLEPERLLGSAPILAVSGLLGSRVRVAGVARRRGARQLRVVGKTAVVRLRVRSDRPAGDPFRIEFVP